LWRNKNSFSLGFCLSFSLLCILWQSNPFAQGMSFFARSAERFSGMLQSGLNFTGTLWVELDEYRDLKDKYDTAQKTIEAYRLEKDKFDLLKLENEKLREALEFQPQLEYPEKRAEVLGVRLNTISPRMIIGKGAEDGVRPFMPVLARCHDAEQNVIRCVVGVIVSVNDSTAIVQPMIHPSYRMGVRVEGKGDWAILSGNSGRPMQVIMTYLTGDYAPDTARLSDTQVPDPGSQVTSSGEGGIFPAGIPVGVVIEKGQRVDNFQTAFIKPYVDIATLDFVSIVMKEPAAWSRDWEKRTRWEEHLQTEFGPPRYPQLPPRERNAQRTRPATPTTNQSQESAEPGQTQTPENNQNQTTDEPPRRVINENIPE
ncbi:MAG: rod shape-determining protein MreC, partial [Leptospiraceae bacterium]|nr:rod shape-determining protein MreC [Leptospiraceae bacterium]